MQFSSRRSYIFKGCSCCCSHSSFLNSLLLSTLVGGGGGGGGSTATSVPNVTSIVAGVSLPLMTHLTTKCILYNNLSVTDCD